MCLRRYKSGTQSEITHEFLRSRIQRASFKSCRARRDMVYRHLDTKTPIGDVYFRPTNLGEVDFEHEEDLAGCFKTHQSEIGYLGKDIITKLADRGTSRIYLF
jgi:hypothetical protein